jgi:hypothetical protein
MLTPRAERRAELNLLFANKRIVASQILFDKDKPELAYSTLVRSVGYLEGALSEIKTARTKQVETGDFLYNLSLASLKHREMVNKMLMSAPDDAKPEIVKIEDKQKLIYSEVVNYLYEDNITPPFNPFNGQE